MFLFQWSLLEHFSGRPTSVLCQSDDRKRRKLILTEMTDKDLNQFISLKSFKQLVDSNPDQFADLLLDNEKFRHFLSNKIDILWQRTETFNIFVGCLHTMAQDMPKDTIGQRVRFFLNKFFQILRQVGNPGEGLA